MGDVSPLDRELSNLESSFIQSTYKHDFHLAWGVTEAALSSGALALSAMIAEFEHNSIASSLFATVGTWGYWQAAKNIHISNQAEPELTTTIRRSVLIIRNRRKILSK